MTAGFWSPLPPARTGVADYAATLLPALRRCGKVVVNGPGAVNLYHIGNNRLHADIYRRALEEPGVVVLHDALLQHLFLGTLGEQAYVDEFVYNYGSWHEQLGQDLWRTRAASGMRGEYYEYPMLKRLVERSHAVVVHNPAAASIVGRHGPATPVVEIPHLFCQPHHGSARESYHFAIFGYLRESKRVLPALRAFQSVQTRYPHATFLLAGQFASTDLERAAAPLLAQPGVTRRGHLPEDDFWEIAAATRVCVNLRYPTAGETSGIMIRLMGLGKPVMVTAGQEVSRIPECACLRVDAGPAEEEMMEAYMAWSLREPAAGREIGARAAAHIREFHAADRIARLYWETLLKHR
jgi:glycosyltransferase involved in cell wall biosynthesis